MDKVPLTEFGADTSDVFSLSALRLATSQSALASNQRFHSAGTPGGSTLYLRQASPAGRRTEIEAQEQGGANLRLLLFEGSGSKRA